MASSYRAQFNEFEQLRTFFYSSIKPCVSITTKRFLNCKDFFLTTCLYLSKAFI